MTQADGVEWTAQRTNQAASHGRVGVVELGHDAVRDQFSDYLDGALTPGERERVDRHLAECRACSAYLATLRKTVELLGQLPARSAPVSPKRAILEQTHPTG